MIKKLSLKTKLIGGFLVVAALCAFVGVFAVVELRDTGTQYGKALDYSVSNLKSVAEMDAAFLQLRIELTRAFAFDSPQTRGTLDNKVREADQRLRQAVSDYEGMIKDDPPSYIEEDRRLLGALSQSFSEYQTQVEEPTRQSLAA